MKLASTSGGEELYTDRTTITVEQEDNAKTEVNELDVAYWPEGNALCLGVVDITETVLPGASFEL